MPDPESIQPPSSQATAGNIISRAPEDLVFAMRFLGQSQELLYNHFRRFLEHRLAEAGVSAETHPLLPFFIDSHAVELRDFVATGVSLARPFRLAEIEILTGDVETLMRVDIWDVLTSHIEMAEARFIRGIDRVVAAVSETPAGPRA